MSRTLLVGALVAAAASAEEPAPAAPGYVLPNTQVLNVTAKANGQPYVLYVSLPRHFSDGRQYPLLVVLDADYAFAVARNVLEHLSDRGDLPEMVVVGVGYPGGISDLPTYRLNRTRDYTPTYTPRGGYGPEFQKVSGGGPKFLEALATELLPFIERRFGTDPAERTLVGHSYGGLFATYALVTRPELFRRYIIVSPSLWYHGRSIFEREAQTAKGRSDLRAEVFFGIGSEENGADAGRMVDDVRAFAAALAAHQYPSLAVTTRVFEEETHDSVFPVAFTRGARAVHARAAEADAGSRARERGAR